ncbi:hypothetical protein K501DRAFT_292003 [Backusella circina FSU 941]|nr:hypothetical protein K501DRAFT_292003 [Backusella circina FSU 941]
MARHDSLGVFILPLKTSLSLLRAIYVSNVPLVAPPPPPPTPQYDENGLPIKIRKKPGRKPNPASPALRKAQNRAAQRAFRERKERHLRDLEGTIRTLREQRNSAVKELNQTKTKLDSFRAENWYLKGVVLTLQFVCLHHNIHIPTHSPYLTEDDLCEMAKTTPHAIEAYVNAYTHNNMNLKPTMTAHFSNVNKQSNENEKAQQEQPTETQEYQKIDEEMDSTEEMDEEVNEEDDNNEEEGHIQNESKKEQQQQQQQEQEGEKETQADPSSSVSAIQTLRLQLRLQSAISNVGKSAPRLQPTILQLAIPHDPRIDLIPTPHMRDRMIIFRDQVDYDRCFAMLLNGAVYHGGDPTMSASWELPAEFFTEFWYLAVNYDIHRTNQWRKIKGLPEIPVGLSHNNKEDVHWHDTTLFPETPTTNYTSTSATQPTDPFAPNTVWTDEVFAQMTAGMPTLQPLDELHLASGFDFGSALNNPLDDLSAATTFPIYHSAAAVQPLPPSPEAKTEKTLSLGTMLDLMNTLSNDMPQ